MSSYLYVKTRILTDLERKRITQYLKADGERDKPVQNLVYRTRKYLLEKLVKNYDLRKTRQAPKQKVIDSDDGLLGPP